MLNFYRKFVPNCFTVLQPLNNLLGKRKLEWNKEAGNALENAKNITSQATILAYPKQGASITTVAPLMFSKF